MNNDYTLILQKLTGRLKKKKAKDIMTKDVITVGKDDNLTDVAELMIQKRISGFPVIENEKIIGIITTNDLFMIMDIIKTGEVLKDSSDIDYIQPKVSFTMSTEIVSVSPETSLDEIITLMKYRNIHTLPVISRDRLTGIIGRRDVFKCFYNEIRDLIS